MPQDNKDQTTTSPTQSEGLPWRKIAIGSGLLLALFIAAPFIQIWVDSIPSIEQTPSIPLISKPPIHNNGTIRLTDGEFIGAATSKENYTRFVQLLHAHDSTGRHQMYSEGLMLKLLNETELTIINSGKYVSEVRPRSGKHEGVACWVPSEFVK